MSFFRTGATFKSVKDAARSSSQQSVSSIKNVLRRNEASETAIFHASLGLAAWIMLFLKTSENRPWGFGGLQPPTWHAGRKTSYANHVAMAAKPETTTMTVFCVVHLFCVTTFPNIGKNISGRH